MSQDEFIKLGPREEAWWLIYGLLVCLLVSLGIIAGLLAWFCIMRFVYRVELRWWT